MEESETEESTGAPGPETNIYQYVDYRAFLKDRFRWLQSRDATFSQRKLARTAGFANPGFFNEVIQGRRKLSSAAIERMGLGMSLETNETEFLRVLVAYTEAKDLSEKEAAHQKLEQRRNRHFFRRLNQSQSKYYLDFNYPLVRAAIEACDFRGNYQILGDFLRPPMQAASVKRYVRDLCEWGLASQDRDGKYHVTHSFLEPPEEMRDALVRLQQAWLSQSVFHLNAVPASERHVSSALLTVGEETYKAILKQVEKMREEILRMVREDKAADRVVLFNIQVLPRGGGRRLRTTGPVLAAPAAPISATTTVAGATSITAAPETRIQSEGA
ncbi:MAG: hypothetical protein JWP91_2161 [Fibrobacteres bacterium]|nr:hypothetical protein [Fibrobacterota bacterium]